MADELNTSLEETKVLEVGDIVEGTVLKVEDKLAILDVSYKQDAVLPVNEISNVFVEKASDFLKEGTRLQ